MPPLASLVPGAIALSSDAHSDHVLDNFINGKDSSWLWHLRCAKYSSHYVGTGRIFEFVVAFEMVATMRSDGLGDIFNKDLSLPVCPRWQGPELRWGAGERADVGMARERLLDAARFCYERLGLASTSMADIAAQAKVTRPTVYRYFKSRQEVIEAVLFRELNGFWWRLTAEVADINEFDEYIVAALSHAIHKACFSEESQFLFAPRTLPFITPVLLLDVVSPGSSQHVVYNYALRAGAQPPSDIALAVEWFNRMLISFLTYPCDKDPSVMGELIANLCPWKSARND